MQYDRHLEERPMRGNNRRTNSGFRPAKVVDILGGNSVVCDIDLGFATTVRRRVKLHGTRLDRRRTGLARDFLGRLKGEEVRIMETGPVDSGLLCVRISTEDMRDVSTEMIKRGFLSTFRMERRE